MASSARDHEGLQMILQTVFEKLCETQCIINFLHGSQRAATQLLKSVSHHSLLAVQQSCKVCLNKHFFHSFSSSVLVGGGWIFLYSVDVMYGH